jgi:hypothetical protein
VWLLIVSSSGKASCVVGKHTNTVLLVVVLNIRLLRDNAVQAGMGNKTMWKWWGFHSLSKAWNNSDSRTNQLQRLLLHSTILSTCGCWEMLRLVQVGRNVADSGQRILQNTSETFQSTEEKNKTPNKFQSSRRTDLVCIQVFLLAVKEQLPLSSHYHRSWPPSDTTVATTRHSTQKVFLVQKSQRQNE